MTYYSVDLLGAWLHKAYMNKANLKGANLQQADMEGVNLQGVDLLGAYLERVILIEAHHAQREGMARK